MKRVVVLGALAAVARVRAPAFRVLVGPAWAAGYDMVSAVGMAPEGRANCTPSTPTAFRTWSYEIGDEFWMGGLGASSTHFIAFGTENGTADYDPGAGTEAVYPGTLLVTRYAF